jgi:hypothetical protein
MNNKYQLVLESLNKYEHKFFKISDAILGCLNGNRDHLFKEFDLVVKEELKDDPWIAIIDSKSFLPYDKIIKFRELHTKDPDKKKVPYFFIVTEKDNKLQYVIYTDENTFYPINTPEEKKKAKEVGINKGLIPKQVTF